MKRGVLAVLTTALGMLLGGCASAPMHFHTLVAPAGMSTPARPTAGYDIAVLPVAVPAQVDRPQMVVRVGASSVVVLDGERWVAPLGDQMRTVIADVVATRLGTQDVFRLASDTNKPLYRIKVQVSRFEAVPGQYTLLWADWRVARKGDDSLSLQCTSQLREAIAPGYAAMVDGHQRDLEALAERIAQGVRALAQNAKAATCPAAVAAVNDSAHG